MVDLGLASSCRGISLISSSIKVYKKLLLQRIRPHLDPLQLKKQSGFYSNRSTFEQILTLSQLIEEIKSKNLTVTLIFVDFKKVFDSINRGEMLEILRAYGVPKKLANAAGQLYIDTEV